MKTKSLLCIFLCVFGNVGASAQLSSDKRLSDHPSFDCSKVTVKGNNVVAQILCGGKDGAAADWELNSTLWALNGSGDEATYNVIDKDQERWRSELEKRCLTTREQAGFSKQQENCVLTEFHKRADLLRSKMVDDALAESHSSPERHAEIQLALARKGFFDGAVDGEFGRKTRIAIKAFQQAEGSPAVGFLTPAQTDRLMVRPLPGPPLGGGATHQSHVTLPVTMEITASNHRLHADAKPDNSAAWGPMFKLQVEKCWKRPLQPFQSEAMFSVKLNSDGSLAEVPVLLKPADTESGKAYQLSGLKALLDCQPYKLPNEYYDEWKFFEPVFTEHDASKKATESDSREHFSPDTRKSSTIKLKSDILGFYPGMKLEDIQSRMQLLSASRKCGLAASDLICGIQGFNAPPSSTAFPCQIEGKMAATFSLCLKQGEAIRFDWTSHSRAKTISAVTYSFYSPKEIKQVADAVSKQFGAMPTERYFNSGVTWKFSAGLQLNLEQVLENWYDLTLRNRSIPILDAKAQRDSINATPDPKF